MVRALYNVVFYQLPFIQTDSQKEKYKMEMFVGIRASRLDNHSFWIYGDLKRTERILSGVEVDVAARGALAPGRGDRVSARVEAQWLPGCSAGSWRGVTSLPTC